MSAMTVEPHDWFAITQLYADYAAIVDAGRWDDWTECFTDDCVYRVQPRENHERGFPLATLSFESKGMLKDRAYGIRETLFHDPYYQRHVVGLPRLRGVDANGWRLEANYAVFRTKRSQPTEIYNVGYSLDTVVHVGAALKFARREFIYDSELIANSMIYPL